MQALAAQITEAVTAAVTAKVEALEQRLQVAERGVVVGLPPEQLRRVGALTLQADRAEAVEHYVMEQRASYERATNEDLIETLLARDRELLTQGRKLADGTVGARLLREFMRAAIYASGGQLNAAAVEKLLAGLGAEPADLRQLARHGSTLGELEDAGDRARQLADGRRPR